MVPVLTDSCRRKGLHLAVGASVLAVFAVTAYFLARDISTVLVHLYYIPIVLIGYCYRRRGIPLIVLTALGYLALVVLYDWQSLAEIASALFRSVIFVSVGTIVALLSERTSSECTEIGHIIENAQDIVYRTDNEGRLVMATPSFATLLGYDSIGECLGKNVARDFYLDPAARDVLEKTIRENGQVTQYTVKLRHRTGRPVVISVSSHLYYDSDGRVAGIEGIFRDITRQHHLEQELRESEGRYREFFTTSRDCVFITSPDGRWLDFNDRALELFGYGKREDLLDTPVTAIYDQIRDRDRIIGQVMRDGYVRDFPVHLKRRDRSVIEALITVVAVKGPDGAIRHFTGTIHDMTEQRRTVAALAESEEKFRQFFNNVNDAIYVHSIRPDGRPGRIIEANEVMCLRLGYSRDELLAMEMPDLLAEEGKRAMPDIAARIRHDGYATFETFHRTKDGTVIPVEVNTHLFIQHGEQLALASARDITDRRKAEAALHSSEQRFRNLFENMQEGLAYCRMVYDEEGRPSDFIYIAINRAFDRITGAGTVVGKPVTEVYPGIREAFPRLFAIYGRVARTGAPESFELDFTPAGKWLHISVYSPARDHFVAIFTDITGQKHAVDALQKSEERFRKIFDAINDAVHIHGVGPDGLPLKIIAVNDAACSMLGYTREELEAKNPLDLVTRYHSRPLEEIGRDLATKGEAVFETEQIRRDGTVLPVEIHAHRSTLAGENVVVSVVRDITERRKIEETLRRSEEQQRLFIRHAPAALAMFDRDMRYLEASQRWMTEYGLGDVELRGRSYYEVFPEISEAWKEVHRRSLAGEIVTADEDRFERADGTVQWLSWEVRPWYTAAGAIGGIIIFSEDITARKTAQEALRKSEETLRENQARLENAMDIAHEADWSFDTRTGIFTFNRRFYALYGTTPEREGGMEMRADVYSREFSHPDDAEMVARVIREVIESPHPPEYTQVEHRIIRRDGQIRYIVVRFSVVRDEQGVVIGTRGVNQDITERKRAEEALHESEEKYRTLVERASEALVIVQDGIIVFANESTSRLTGTPVDTLVGSPVTGFIAPGDRDLVLSRYRQREAGGNVAETYDFRVIGPGGSLRWVSLSAALVTWNGRPATLNLLTDITGRKVAEEELWKSRQLLESIINTIPVRVFWKDRNLVFLGCNRAFAQDAGFENPQDLIGKDDFSMVWKSQAGLYRADDRNVIESGRDKILYEEPQTTPSGQKSYLLTSKVALRDAGGEIIGILGTYLDITARKQAENALRESEHRLNDIINFLPDPTFVIDRSGTVIAWNYAIAEMTGISREEVIGRGEYEHAFRLFGYRRPLLVDLVLNTNEDELTRHYPAIRKEGSVLSGQFHVPSFGGKPADIWITATPLFNSEGEITGAIESIREITEIKATEKALRDLTLTLEERVKERTRELEDAKNYNRNLIEADLDPLLFVRPDGIILDVNSAAETMLGAGRTELAGTNIREFVEEPERATQDFTAVLETGRVIGARHRVRSRGGAVTPVLAGGVLLRDNAGQPTGVFITLHDITRILEDEEKINAQLREKEVLLREIHHRVKNNLQIITSLISLQARALHDRDTIEALHETQNRVRAISIVHERLHLSGDLGTVDLEEYIRYLATALYSFYQRTPAEIRLTLEVENVIVDIDTAAPLGLIFNELLSNMLKYAFPGGRKGECRITAHQEGRQLRLTLQDNGVGIPESLDWKNSPTLGLRLVSILVGQLHGTIELDRAGGTRFVIAITLPEKATGIHRVGGL